MTLTAWIEGAFRRHATRTALRDGERAFSYAELDASSAAAGRALLAAGVKPGDRVGILAEKSAETIFALLGALRIGAAYVPLDPRSPPARNAALGVAARLRAVVGASLPGIPPVNVVAPAPEIALPGSRPESAAYLLFTSGSTGTPKAVEISQRAALAFADWAATFTGLRPDDKVASTAALGFDLSTYELFSSFGTGACVVLARPGLAALPGELARLFSAEGITVWYSVPSSITLLAGLAKLRLLLSAGDVFAAAPAAALRREGDGRVFNLYGPTETNVCLAHEVVAGARGEVPIGVPAAGDECRLLADDGSLVEHGEGELVVRGPTVMTAYFGEEAATAGAFVADEGGRWYRTGDLAARSAGGPFFYRGRRDGQVKVWGHRVHPLETETALLALPGVSGAAVVAVSDARAGSALHAFVVAGGVGAASLRSALLQVLPAPLVPEEIHEVDELPLTPNGKVDRARLVASLR